MFDLNTNIDELSTEEVHFYCKELWDIVKRRFEKHPVQSVWLADLLSLQRLYNTYEFLQNKQGKEGRELYKTLLDILWNITAGKNRQAEELDPYGDLEEIAELLACGTKEDLMEDYISPSSPVIFNELLDLAGDIAKDYCMERNQDIAACPCFLEEVKNCCRDCLIACEESIVSRTQPVIELRDRYLSEFFMGVCYKSI